MVHNLLVTAGSGKTKAASPLRLLFYSFQMMHPSTYNISNVETISAMTVSHYLLFLDYGGKYDAVPNMPMS